MNLPNKITILRACLIPLFVVLMVVPGIAYGKWWALAVFIIAAVSDFFDGYLARKHGLVTNFGKFMDPLADKMLVCAALICFVELVLMPSWIVIIIISREFIISGFRMVASGTGLVIAASYWAKIKTVTQMITCCFFIGNLDYGFANVIEQVLMYLTLALTIISMVDYLYKNRRVLGNGIEK